MMNSSNDRMKETAPSLRRKPESIIEECRLRFLCWIPAFAGMTKLAAVYGSDRADYYPPANSAFVRFSRQALMTVSMVAALLLSRCEFTSSFEQIEENRVRTIDFIYRNRADTSLCEAAPGDSMEVTAIFSGEKVREIALSVSFDVQTSVYGQMTALDSLPLDYSVVTSTLDGEGTDADTFAFRFSIPENILVKSSFLPEEHWAATLPAELRESLPEELTALKKSGVIALLEQLSVAAEASDPELLTDSLTGHYGTGFVSGLETLLQLFSAPVRLKALVNGHYEIVSYCTVRYHRRLQVLDESIVCNRNPHITRMGIYRVHRNNLFTFDPTLHTQKHDTIVLYDADKDIDRRDYTLHIEKDRSYFLFTEGDPPQQILSLSGVTVPETHYFKWWYQQDFTGNDSVPSAQRMAITNGSDGPIVPLLPAATRRINHCGIWVQIHDEATGPRLYPNGSSVFHTDIYFNYSDDYIKNQEVL